MDERDLTFEQWCVEVAGLECYNFIAPCDYDVYYEQYEEYLEEITNETS